MSPVPSSLTPKRPPIPQEFVCPPIVGLPQRLATMFARATEEALESTMLHPMGSCLVAKNKTFVGHNKSGRTHIADLDSRVRSALRNPNGCLENSSVHAEMDTLLNFQRTLSPTQRSSLLQCSQTGPRFGQWVPSRGQKYRFEEGKGIKGTKAAGSEERYLL